MDNNNVSFQTAELGKVDQGGGGTIAYILGNYNMLVIDSGVAVLNMHAPWEIISKADLYEAKHWHGAAPDSCFPHLAAEAPAEGVSSEWLEAIADTVLLHIALTH